LTTNPDTVRAPDVGVYLKSRLPGGLTGKYFPGAPDFAIEIMSPNDTADDIQEKVLEYLQYGTRLIWVIYPKTRTVVVHTPEMTHTVTSSGTLNGGDVLPKLKLPVSEIFACLDE
jgi:Uma2 family endonuclease